MAEAAAVATIVGIASFGIQLTQVLYNFGSNVSSAREDTNHIARHVDLYANVLDILTERIDDDEPILSDAAFDLIDELQYQSNELFTQIEQLLPTPKEGKDDISFLQKVKWNFTKTRVALLVGELDYLRSTVHLLVTIIFTGKKIRSRRKKAKSSTDGAPDLDNDIRKQGLKAQNALLAQLEAQQKIPELEKDALRQESTNSNDTNQICTQQPSTCADVICTATTALANLQQSLALYTDPAERQRVVLQHSGHVLRQLLQQWTNVDLLAPEAASQEKQDRSANKEKPTATSEHEHHVNATELPLRSRPEAHDPLPGSGTNPRTPGTEKAGPTVSPTPEKTNFSAAEWADGSGKIFQQPNVWRSSMPDGSGPAQPANEVLPPGWTKHWDTASGRFYYFDTKKLKAQWEVPNESIVSDASTFERKSTPYASTTNGRTFVGSERQSSKPTLNVKSADPGKRDIFERFFGIRASGANNSNTDTGDEDVRRLQHRYDEEDWKPQSQYDDDSSDLVVEPDEEYLSSRQTGSRSSNACRACNGRGGREDKFKSCQTCDGKGWVFRLRNLSGGGTVKECPHCKGEGRTINEMYRCKVCNGTGKQPRTLDFETKPQPDRATSHDDRLASKYQAAFSAQQVDKGRDREEFEPGRVECASQ